MGLRCEYVSWERFCALAVRLAQRIRASGFVPQVLVAVGRGGYLPARLLSDFFGIVDLATFRIEHYKGSHKEPLALVRYPLNRDLSGLRVLLVDDVNDSGDTFELALSHIAENGSPVEIRTAALHHKTCSRYLPDFYAQRLIKWRWITYPWALAEDLSVLLNAMDPRPASASALRQRLAKDHGMQVPARILAQTLRAAALVT
jgi:hypoxanthine phosphoribosyltransferase